MTISRHGLRPVRGPNLGIWREWRYMPGMRTLVGMGQDGGAILKPHGCDLERERRNRAAMEETRILTDAFMMDRPVLERTGQASTAEAYMLRKTAEAITAVKETAENAAAAAADARTEVDDMIARAKAAAAWAEDAARRADTAGQTCAEDVRRAETAASAAGGKADAAGYMAGRAIETALSAGVSASAALDGLEQARAEVEKLRSEVSAD